jgi:hypothetical protein
MTAVGAVGAVGAVQGKEALESPPVARHDVWLARGFDGASSASFVLLNPTALERRVKTIKYGTSSRREAARSGVGV